MSPEQAYPSKWQSRCACLFRKASVSTKLRIALRFVFLRVGSAYFDCRSAQALNTGAQHRRSTQALNTGAQHRRSPQVLVIRQSQPGGMRILVANRREKFGSRRVATAIYANITRKYVTYTPESGEIPFLPKNRILAGTNH